MSCFHYFFVFFSEQLLAVFVFKFRCRSNCGKCCRNGSLFTLKGTLCCISKNNLHPNIHFTTKKFPCMHCDFHSTKVLFLCICVEQCMYYHSIHKLQGTGQNAERIWMTTICGSVEPIYGSVITVGLRLGLRLGIWLGLALGLLIVVLQTAGKVTKCGSITWSKLTNGDPPRCSFCRVPDFRLCMLWYYIAVLSILLLKKSAKPTKNRRLYRTPRATPQQGR